MDMNKIPAFPHDADAAFNERTGMTMRDFFAAHATEEDIRALVAYGESWTSANDRAAARYRHADAMLAAR
jgi:hypothetical protein